MYNQLEMPIESYAVSLPLRHLRLLVRRYSRIKQIFISTWLNSIWFGLMNLIGFVVDFFTFL